MRNRSSVLCGLCVVILTLSALTAQQTHFRVASLVLVSSTSLPDGQLESTYRVRAQNLGAAAATVTANITKGQGHANLVVVDGGVTFGAIAAGQIATSLDTFTIRDRRRQPHNPVVLLNPAGLRFEFSTGNAPPVAAAGPDQTVAVGSTVVFDGSESADADGDSLTFDWQLLAAPGGCEVPPLTNSTAVNPSMFIPCAGTYVVQLVVNDGTVSSAPDAVTISTGNTAPVADAGMDQFVAAGASVHLDGSSSSDVDGDLLTFAWSFHSKPAGSAAVLSDPAAVMPTFVADVPGTYELRLNVNDGVVDSSPDFVRVTTSENLPPVADAGLDQSVRPGVTVHLNGSGSSDPNGDPLTFRWSFVSTPAASSATLSDSAAVNPTFVADLLGVYVVQLIVGDGSADSLPDTVKITSGNTSPVANAGPDQMISVASTVGLDGSGSTDVDGDPLTFSWALVVKPVGSTAAVDAPTTVRPTFVADIPGTYVAQLTVNDGSVNSAPDTVVITTENLRPVADAGEPQTVPVGSIVQLNGSGSSDPDGDVLSFSWSFIQKPVASMAVISDATSIVPNFAVDVPGTYIVQLIVNDGKLNSAPDSVTITTENSQPVANAGPDQTVTVGTVQLDGSGSSDPDFDALTYSWSLIAKPLGSTAVLSGPAGVNPTFVADMVGQYVAQLIVNDGHVNSLPDTVSVTVGPSEPDRVIGCGVLVSGTISAPGQVDQFTFSGQSGDIINLALASTGGFDTIRSAALRLFAPSGSSVGGTLLSNGQATFTLPETGTYTIRVNAQNLSQTGSYNLGRHCFFPAPSPNAVMLPCGGLRSGTIDAPVKVDIFTFSGQSGDIINLALASTGGFDTIRSAALTLFSPSGSAVGATLLSNGQATFTLPEDGGYVVRVNAQNLSQAGTYNVSLHCLFPTPSPNAVMLACGTVASGTINVAGEVDLYTFSGQSGDIINLALASTGGFDTIRSAALTLFAPSGSGVGGTLLSNGQATFTLPQTGTYIIRVSAQNLSQTGSYNVSRQCLFPTPTPSAVMLTCGTPQAGTINAPADVDLFTFVGQAGTVITLSLVSTGGFTTINSAALRLFAPSGSALGNTLLSNGQAAFALSEGGTYVIRVSAQNLSQTGTFNVALQCP